MILPSLYYSGITKQTGDLTILLIARIGTSNLWFQSLLGVTGCPRATASQPHALRRLSPSTPGAQIWLSTGPFIKGLRLSWVWRF